MPDATDQDYSVSRDLARKSAAGFFWNVTGTAGQMISRIIGVGILARFIGPAETGLWAIVTLVYFPLKDLVGSGFTPTLVRRRRFRVGHLRRAMGLLIIIGGVLAAVIALGAYAAEDLMPAGLTTSLFLVGAAAAFCDLQFIAVKSQLVRNMQFREITCIGFAGMVAGFWLTALPLAIYGWGAWALGVGVLVESIVKFAGALMVQPIRPRFDLYPLRQYLRESAGFSLVGTLNSWARTIDNYVVSVFLGAEQLGVYTRAYALSELPTRLIAQSSENVLLPMFARRQDDSAALPRNLLDLLQTYLLLMAPIALFTAVFADDVVRLYLGEKWLSVAAPLSVLSLTLIGRPLARPALTALKSRGRVRTLIRLQLLYLCSIAAACSLLVRYGLAGVAWGVNLGVGLLLLGSLFAVNMELGIGWSEIAKRIWPISMINVLLAAMMGATELLLHREGVGSIAIFVVVTVSYPLIYAVVLLIWSDWLIPKPLLRLPRVEQFARYFQGIFSERRKSTSGGRTLE